MFRKFPKFLPALLAFLIILGAMTYFGVKLYQDRNSASAENITATTLVYGNSLGKLVLSPDNNFVYAATFDNFVNLLRTVTKYDAATNTELASLPMPNTGIVINATGSKLYVFTSNNQITVIDTASFTVTGSIPINMTLAVSGKAFLNPGGNKLYVLNNINEVSVIDTATDTVISTFNTTVNTPSGPGNPAYITNADLLGTYVFSQDGSRLYLSGSSRAAVIDTSTDTFLNFIPTQRDLTLSEDGTKLYSPDFNGFRVFNLTTNKLERSIVGDNIHTIIAKNNKIYTVQTSGLIRIFDNRTFIQTATAQVPNGCSGGQCFAKITEDGSKIYISYTNNTTYYATVFDTNSLTFATINPGVGPNPTLTTFSADGKTAYIIDVGSYKTVETSLITSSDITSFDCTSPTGLVASTVTCTVNASSAVRGLAKFEVGLESCTAYFAPGGASSASCTYPANNIQTAAIVIKPSFGATQTGGNLAITGTGTTMTGTNVFDDDCTSGMSTPLKVGVILDCNFTLTGSVNNTYILPSAGIQMGINSTVALSDFCTLINNGTPNVRLNCKNIPTLGGNLTDNFGTGGGNFFKPSINGVTNVLGSTFYLFSGFKVNTNLDTLDTAVGDGFCLDSNGLCSVRAAVMESNADYKLDNVYLANDTYTLTIAPTTESVGAIDGDLDINTDIDFTGYGEISSIIQAGTNNTNGIDRVFHIYNANVRFNYMTIRNGRALDSTGTGFYYVSGDYPTKNAPGSPLISKPGNGGGIYFQKYYDFDVYPETPIYIDGYNYDSTKYFGSNTRFIPTVFQLNNVKVSDNYAQNGGGGVYDASGWSNYSRADITGNTSGKYGGGVARTSIQDRVTKVLVEPYFADEQTYLILNFSNVSGNNSIDGAGIYHDRGNQLTLDENTTITGNIASGKGGGIFNTECSFIFSGGTVSIYGASINSNSAVDGGGIYNECGHVEAFQGNVTSSINTRINNNIASGKGSAWYGRGNTLNDLERTTVAENNTANPGLTYPTGQLTSVIWMESTARLNILTSTLENNWGRAVEFIENARININSTTISGNSGRGVSYTTPPTNLTNSELTMVNSTIASNDSSGITFRSSQINFQASHLTVVGNAYGLIIDPNTEIDIDNSIIGGNININCGDLNDALFTSPIAGSSRGTNLSDNNDCDNIIGFTQNPNIITLLGGLSYNGGFNNTMPLLLGNPAIDGGSGSPTYDGYPSSPTTDQRGFARPTGSTYDIGAYEAQVLLPIANDDNIGTDPNTTVYVDVLANDTQGTDPIDTNSVVVVDYPTKGTLNDLGNGNFEYIPDPLQYPVSGTDFFTYYFFDTNSVQSNTATVNINVVVVAPIANDDNISTDPDTSVNVDVLANDTPGNDPIDTNSVVVVDSPTKGTLNDLGNGIFEYIPDPLQYPVSGTDFFTYYFFDTNGVQSNTATVNINVVVDSIITGASCTPRSGYLTVSPTCVANFTPGRTGTITFTTSAGSCTTANININDTSASCSFTISTPSVDTYAVNLTATDGDFRNGFDNIFVSPLPSLISLNPASGTVLGGTTSVANFSVLGGNDRLYGVVKDSLDNIYVVGQSNGSVQFGSTAINGFGSSDIFIAKYDSAGNPIWAKTAGGTGDDLATGIVIDSNNNIYVAGYFQSLGNFGGTNIFSNGQSDVFISKLDSNGNFIWTNTAGSTETDEIQGIDIDSTNNIYVAGHFYNSINLGANTLTSSGLNDVFIAKLDSNGNYIWANRAGTTSFDLTGDIAVNPIDNSVYVSGHYNNISVFGSTNLILDMGRSGYDSFLAKTDPSGNWVWAKDIGNTGVDTYANDFGFSNKVYTDTSGNAYIMGGFYKNFVDFGPAGQITNTAQGGAPQHYIAKADSNGDFIWATKLGETGYYLSSAFNVNDGISGYLSTTIFASPSIILGGTTLNKTNSSLTAIVAEINLSNGILSNAVQSTGTGITEVIRDIDVDSNGNLILVGNSSGASAYGSQNYTSSVLNDQIIVKLNTTSNTFNSLQGRGGVIPFFVNFIPAQNSLTLDSILAPISAINSPIRATITTPAHAPGFVNALATNSISLTSSLNNAYEYLNNPPVANPDSATTLLTSPVNINVPSNDTDTDVSLDLTTVTIVTGPIKGGVAVNPTTGVVTYTPNPSLFPTASTDTFTYTIRDNFGAISNNATVTINVTLPPQPQANPDTISTPESTLVNIPVLTNDLNSTNICTNSLSISPSSVGNGTVSIVTIANINQVQFTPTLGFYGTFSFSYTACSTVVGTSPSAPALVTVTVNQVNPVAVNDTATTNQSDPITINVLANDSDPSLQTLTICTPLNSVSNGTISVTTILGVEQIIFTPTFGFSGSTSFTYAACDPAGNSSNTATVNVTVIPNTAPVANPDSANTISNNPVQINLPANDTDSDGSLDLTSVTIVSGGTKGNIQINPTTGVVTYTPITSLFSTNENDTFTYRIKDNDGDFSNTATVTIAVTVNPVAVNDFASTLVSSQISVNVLTNDTATSAPLDPTSVVVTTLPTKGTFSITNAGVVIYTPNPALNTVSGTDTFAYTVQDTENHTSNPATVTVNITVPPANQPPVANNDTASGDKNTSIIVNVLANDTDADGTINPASVTISVQPTKGSLTINTTTGAVTYIPNVTLFPTTGTDNFSYFFSDDDGTNSNVATVNITVTSVVQNVQLTLYKSKQDADIIINQPLQIQADITNPNNFVVPKIQTIINIDTTKLNFVGNSARQGSIVGNKYLSWIDESLKLFSLNVNAQNNNATSVSFQVLSDSQLQVTVLNAQPNQTIPIVFDVLPKATLQNSISGTANVVDVQTNQTLASANAEVRISPTAPPQNVLVRTGGEWLYSIGGIMGLLIIGYLYKLSRAKKIKTDLKS